MKKFKPVPMPVTTPASRHKCAGCGLEIERSMKALRAHILTECTAVKRRGRQ